MLVLNNIFILNFKQR